MNWIFNDEIFTSDDIGIYEGFCYLITNNLNGRKYIGRKYFFDRRKGYVKKTDRDAGKKVRRQKKESNWQKYWGSSEELLNDIEEFGHENFTREILSLHKTRGDCNYTEIALQFKNDVLESEKWYNLNIAGKWHRKPQHIVEDRKLSKLLTS